MCSSEQYREETRTVACWTVCCQSHRLKWYFRHFSLQQQRTTSWEMTANKQRKCVPHHSEDSQRWGYQHGWVVVRTTFFAADCPLFTVTLQLGERGLQGSLPRTLIYWCKSSLHNYLPKAPPLKTITLGDRRVTCVHGKGTNIPL